MRARSFRAASIALTGAAAVLALSGCDAATQIAGDAVRGEARTAIDLQCRQVAENAGIVAGRVAEVCACSVETFLAESDVSVPDVSPARIETIVNSCAGATGANSDKQILPTEEAGG
ncbi:hypothetical protein GRI40_03030 [Altererythrobacter aerius]|uniref:Succinate dehydrogenase n=1 Tax=Tsuneonella aeria TaxID=1837929 RepID=A0A6I4TC68_9SPHN|nr:hypothetical protein [Tsuneonella aeria]MXO74196.1 hypothetical protein [Tsuneonella aeria]